MPESAASAKEAPQKSLTKWTAFEQAGLVPVQISCQAYKPVHGADMSCHTRLLFNADTLKRHMDSEHGGGFYFVLRKTDGKPSPLWKQMEQLGLEAHDFRCDNCDAQLRFHPSSFTNHMRAHGGKTRRVYDGGRFNVTLGMSRPDREENDDAYDNAA